MDDNKVKELMDDLDVVFGDSWAVMGELQAKEEMLNRLRDRLDANLSRFGVLRKELADELGMPGNPEAVWVAKSAIRSLDRLAEMREALDKLEFTRGHLNELITKLETESQRLHYDLREMRKGVHKLISLVNKELR